MLLLTHTTRIDKQSLFVKGTQGLEPERGLLQAAKISCGRFPVAANGTRVLCPSN